MGVPQFAFTDCSFPTFGNYKQNFYKHQCSGLCVNINFELLLVNIKESDFCIISQKMFSFIWETVKLSSKAAAPFYIPTNNE